MDDILSHVLGASYRYRTPGGAVTTWWPHCTQDLSIHPQSWELTTRHRNKSTSALKINCGRFGWHHGLNGHEFGRVPRVGDGQGRLVCCSPWGGKESDMTDRLNWIESNQDDTHQTTHDQCEDDCTISACNPPPTLSIKLSPPTCHGGWTLAFEQMSATAPASCRHMT